MQLIIKNGRVLATHRDDQVVADLYPGCEIVFYRGPFTVTVEDPCPLDPRTPDHKVYSDQRRVAYPTVADQLDMRYWDQINGTNVWQDTITAIKARYPK